MDVDVMLAHPFWVYVDRYVYLCFDTVEEAREWIASDQALMAERPAIEGAMYEIKRVTVESVPGVRPCCGPGQCEHCDA